MKNYLKGGILGLIGFLLSPLSWWNDLVVNLPIAYGFGFLISLINRDWFGPAMAIGYLLTNIIGLVLLHLGVIKAVSKENMKITKKDILKDLIISIVYSVLIIILVSTNIIKLPQELFRR